MRKRYLLALILLFCGVSPGDRPEAGDTPPTIRIGVPKAPPAIPILHMIDSGAMLGRADIEIDVWSAPEQLIAMVQDGGHDMFVLPLTVAAKLHNKGIGIRLTDVNTWGVADLVTSDPTVKGWGDLGGKTLFVPVKSSTPDVLTRYFLGRAGLSPGRDLEIIYLPAMEIGQLLKAGEIANAVLLEPHVTAATAGNPALRVVLGFQDEWQRIGGGEGMLPNVAIGAATAFLDANPALVRGFEAEYRKAVAWVLGHPGEAGALAEKYLGLRADTIASAVPRLGLHYKTAVEAAPEVDELYRLLYDFSPDTIGRKIPDATLYWR